MVVVQDDFLPRGFWKLGLVEELFEGKDGVAKVALVRLAPKNGKRSVLRRPIQCLYPLEVRQVTEKIDLTEGCNSTATEAVGKTVPESDSETNKTHPK